MACEPDEFVVHDTNKKCRGCGKRNSSLNKTAHSYLFSEVKCFTAWICATCRHILKRVHSLLFISLNSTVLFFAKSNKTMLFIMFAVELP